MHFASFSKSYLSLTHPEFSVKSQPHREGSNRIFLPNFPEKLHGIDKKVCVRAGHSVLNPPVDFSPNENKSKNNMVARGITYLETNALPVVYLKYYLLGIPLTTDSRSNRNFFLMTTCINVSIARHGMSLVTILLLDFILIH